MRAALAAVLLGLVASRYLLAMPVLVAAPDDAVERLLERLLEPVPLALLAPSA